MPTEARGDAPLPDNLFGWERPALSEFFRQWGEPGYRAEQVHRWIYQRRRLDPATWSDMPLALRRRLAASCRFDAGAIAARTEAHDGTVKFRIALPAGGFVEAVSMTQEGRATLCISSQVGCALDCAFCLTGKMGLARHLSPGEIAGQVALVLADRRLEDRAFNVVFMGMGEPLHNYDGVLGAFRLLTDPHGFGLSRLRVTVSTAGLAPAIERLAREPVRPRLAVSLNATTDALRDRLMPVNRKYPLARLFEACSQFARTTREPFTFEYVLLAGVNDAPDDVARLSRILARYNAKLNLIPFNAVPGWLDYQPPESDKVLAIRDRLLAEGRKVSIRWSRGGEARAACGQLALLPERPQSDPPARGMRAHRREP